MIKILEASLALTPYKVTKYQIIESFSITFILPRDKRLFRIKRDPNPIVSLTNEVFTRTRDLRCNSRVGARSRVLESEILEIGGARNTKSLISPYLAGEISHPTFSVHWVKSCI